ncbi:MAG: DUF6438 domain-containing protein [Chitinophagales bacterium]|nr:DUF6438 domain-containing protein [Chitinophagales bacterium]
MNKYLFFSLLVLLSSCSIKNKIAKLKDTDILVSLDKGPCATKCSEYNVKVYNNGYVIYEGKTNVEKYGLYAKKLSASDLKSLQLAYDKNEFFIFEDFYPNPDPGMPTIVMVYNKEGKTKTITGGLNRPKKVLDLQRMLEAIVYADGFTQIEAYDEKTTQILREDDGESKPATYVLDQEIIIELHPNNFLGQWLQKYQQYGVQLVKKVSEKQPYWIITYNKNLISPDAILSTIQQDPQIKSAEFNKAISNR